MSGTIRCKHGLVMEPVKEVSTMIFLKPTDEVHMVHCEAECQLVIPKEVYENIQQGANFTHVFFPDRAQLDAYKKEHADRFHFVGSAEGTLDFYGTDMIHLIF